MRRWYVPVTLLGLSGVGVLVLTERGRLAVRRVCDKLHLVPKDILSWNDAAQLELDRIQAALARVAASLETVPDNPR
ncbi:MAG: hypothetical protein ABSD20_06015 [Terriglobales bacterium]|jgi:hypothetical protein